MSRISLAALVLALGALPLAAFAQSPAPAGDQAPPAPPAQGTPAEAPVTPVPDKPQAAPEAAAPAAGEQAPVQKSVSPEPPGLVSAAAQWTEDGQVDLKVVFQGGACQQPGEAQVAAVDSLLDHVTIPTTQTAEVCTMQLVEVTYEGMIAVEPTTQTLEITVLDTNGEPQAAGSVDLEAAPKDPPAAPGTETDRAAEPSVETTTQPTVPKQ